MSKKIRGSVPIEKNDTLRELLIESMGSDGEGVGRVEGFTVFVPGALPGERVDAHVIKLAANYGVAKLLRILEPSPDRVEAACPAFPRCGGCTLQHLAYEAQLQVKQKAVKDALERLGGQVGVEVLPTLGMEEPWHYRNKGSFPFANIGGRVEIGFYAPKSHRLIPLSDCDIQRGNVVLLALAVCRFAREKGLSAYDEASHSGLLRHITVRETKDESLMAILSCNGSLTGEIRRSLVETLTNEFPTLRSLVYNKNTSRTNVIFGDSFELIWGEGYIVDNILGLNFALSAASFLQVNPEQTEKLYNKVLEYLALKGGERVADIYCGIGTISLLLAKRAGQVIGIEAVEQAVLDARENAKRNGISNAEFIAGAAEDILPKLVRDGLRPDALVLDPPRKGCEEPVLQAILDSGVQKLVYVSCNPATLARDCRILEEGGFKLIKAQPVDMFPHTGHVETVCLLPKLQAKQHIVVDINMDELDLTAAEKRATYEEIKAYVLEHSGLRVSSLYIAQVKQKHGIIERENYNKSKSDDAKQPQCPPEKEKAIVEALKHFGMI